MSTVLYIEDDVLNMNLVRKSLKPMNYTMLEAWTGTEGIQMAKEQLPNLILLDLHLPDMWGIDVAAQIKINPMTSHIPIVALTADVTNAIEYQCLNGDFDAYLAKPVRRANLLRTIQQMISVSS